MSDAFDHLDEAATTATRSSIAALATRLIDYAGLFPPAKLDMAPTVENYAAHLAGPETWMLARLIVPAKRLDEFEAAASSLLPTSEDDEAWLISALTAPAGDEGFKSDLDRIHRFNDRHADPAHGWAQIDVIELKGGSLDGIESALEALDDDIFPFFEIAHDRDPRGLVAALVGSDAGAKIRTGGVTADLFPTPENVARFIRACAAAGVPFKATAGLHHPVRHFAASVETEMFGFFNIFLAAALLFANPDHRDAEVLSVLTETDAGAFTFDDDGASVGSIRVSLEAIVRAREVFAVSYGSCSFDEPRDDLRGLGLLAS